VTGVTIHPLFPFFFFFLSFSLSLPMHGEAMVMGDQYYWKKN